MCVRIGFLSLAAAVVLALSLGAARADASTTLGSADTSAAPDGFVCAMCPGGTSLGFVQFALRDAAVQAPEDGVLVAASVQAKRIAGGEPPRIAVLRPTDDGSARVTAVGSAPLPVFSAQGSVHRVEGLHLPVRKGDSVGFLFRAGEVDLGVRMRAKPDGAFQSFSLPCGPCGMDGGTGVELLYDVLVEPDVDQDGLGDESQDPDGGGLGLDWEDDWFDDFEAGDELDEDLEEGASRRERRQIRLLDADRRRGGGASLLLRVPRAGRVSAAVTLPANRRTGAGPFQTILTGDMRVRRAGRVRLRLAATPRGARVLERRRRVRTKAVVAYFPRRAPLTLLMHSARL
ncbi:MAG TPA: hypothetical protein VEX67_10535 [Solirubrobacteraceae bacterium]|nr:hypothetical protein [Solirubrobacteraceae bacterium]